MLTHDLVADGVTVELAALEARAAPPLADYDAVVIGARVRFGRHDRAVIDYIRDQRDALVTLPAFFYSIGGHVVFDRDTLVHRMTTRTGWQPTSAATFAGAGAQQRADVRAFARRIAGEIPAMLQPSIA